MGSELRLRDGVRVEAVGDEAVLLDASGETVHRVTGDAVRALELLADGVSVADVPEDLLSVMDDLTALGVLDTPSLWSRRRTIIAGGGAAFAAATVTTFALAGPVAALTECTGDAPTTTPQYYSTPGAYSFKTGPGVTSLLVRAWGGGGGGGGGDDDSTGGGGGGGEYRGGTIAVSACTTYTITVGAGGQRGGAAGTGNGQGGLGNNVKGAAGGSSSFGSLLIANGGGGGEQGSPHAGSGGGAGGAGGTSGTGGSVHHDGGRAVLTGSGVRIGSQAPRPAVAVAAAKRPARTMVSPVATVPAARCGSASS